MKVGISDVTNYRIITHILKRRKLSKKKIGTAWIEFRSDKNGRSVYRVQFAKLRSMKISSKVYGHKRHGSISTASRRQTRRENDVALSLRKFSSVAVSSRLGHQALTILRTKVMVVLTMVIKGICCYKILAEDETVNAIRHLEAIKRFIDHWYGNRKRTVSLVFNDARLHCYISTTF